MKKKLFDNSNLQDEIVWGNIPVGELTDEELHGTNWNREDGYAALRGRTLEELIGEERAAEGRKKRAKAASHPRDPATVKKILTTKKKTGVYDSPTHGMRGKQHRAETKVKQSTKAQVRQDLKRRLGLGRNDSIPRDVLEAEYQQLKL